MNFSDHTHCLEIRLYPDEIDPEATSLPLPPEYRKVAAEFLARREALAREREEEARLATEAAEACPIKVGQEVMDPTAWRNAGQWWRVMSIGGTPSSPWLDCRAVLASGETGSKKETFFSLYQLRVRDNTEGQPREKQRPLKELAAEISAALRAVPVEKRPDRWLSPSAYSAGPNVKVRYRYGNEFSVKREVAEDYLAALKEGWVGSVYDLREYRRDQAARDMVEDAGIDVGEESKS